MATKILLYPPYQTNYLPPENFTESDKGLFDDSHFKNSIDHVELRILKLVVITNSHVFRGNNALFSYTHHIRPILKLSIKEVIKKWLFTQNKIEEASLGIQDWNSNYYHWMTETLPCIFAIYQVKNEMPVLLNCGSKHHHHIEKSLAILNIPYRYIKIKETIKISALYAVKIPVVDACNEQSLNSMKSAFYTKLNLDKDKTPFRKIYISRKKANRRKVANEEELVALLQSNGFESVCLEDYQVDEQIKLLSQTAILVSSHGAGLTNLLFMQPKQMVIELKAQNNNYWCFFTLARLAKLQYKYLLCESDIENIRYSNITVNINRMKDLLKT